MSKQALESTYPVCFGIACCERVYGDCTHCVYSIDTFVTYTTYVFILREMLPSCLTFRNGGGGSEPPSTATAFVHAVSSPLLFAFPGVALQTRDETAMLL